MRPFILATCLAISTAISTGPTLASNHLTGGSGEVQPPGNAPGYVVLRQPQADHTVTVYVRPVAGQGGDPANHVWERTDPTGNAYTEQRSIRWNATAACAQGIDWIRISGPGGTQTQTFNGSRNAIAGVTLYDSFDPDALDAVCLAWGQSMNTACANGDRTNCPPSESFDETARPILRTQPIQVSGRCTNGAMQTEPYRPRLNLICRRTR